MPQLAEERRGILRAKFLERVYDLTLGDARARSCARELALSRNDVGDNGEKSSGVDLGLMILWC